MPDDLVVRPLAGSAAAAAAGRAAPAAKPAEGEQAAPAHANPSLRLDPALGLVVIEFRDADGSVARSIPSARQLEAYRRAQEGSAGAAQDTAAGTAPSRRPDGA